MPLEQGLGLASGFPKSYLYQHKVPRSWPLKRNSLPRMTPWFYFGRKAECIDSTSLALVSQCNDTIGMRVSQAPVSEKPLCKKTNSLWLLAVPRKLWLSPLLHKGMKNDLCSEHPWSFADVTLHLECSPPPNSAHLLQAWPKAHFFPEAFLRLWRPTVGLLLFMSMGVHCL